MKCIKTQSMITTFINDKLPINDIEEFLDHVGSCPKCREELEVYYALLTAMKQLDDDKDLSSDFVHDLDEKLEEAAEKIIHVKYKYYRKISMLILTMILLVFLFSFSYANRSVENNSTIIKSDFRIRIEFREHRDPYLELQLQNYFQEHEFVQPQDGD